MSEKKKTPIWDRREVVVLKISSAWCFLVGLAYLMMDKPGTATVGIAAAVLFLTLSKIEEFELIEGLGFKLKRAEKKLQEAISVAENLANKLKQLAIRAESDRLQASLPDRPQDEMQQRAARAAYDEFAQSFKDLECSESQIHELFAPWRENLKRQHAEEVQRHLEARFQAAASTLSEIIYLYDINLPGIMQTMSKHAPHSQAEFLRFGSLSPHTARWEDFEKTMELINSVIDDLPENMQYVAHKINKNTPDLKAQWNWVPPALSYPEEWPSGIS